MKKLLMLPALILILFLVNTNEVKPQLINLVVSVTGSVIDEITRLPISVELEVFDTTGTRVSRARSNAKDGYYFVTGLKPGRKYFIRNIIDFDSEKRFFRQKFEIDIPYTDKYAEFSKDLMIKPLRKDEAIPLKVTPFGNEKSKIRAGAESFLKDLAEVMKDNQRVKFEIACYPDNDANSQQNLTITSERTKELKAFFVANGVNESRISTLNSGKTDPKNPPPTQKTAKGKRYKGSVYIIVRGL